MHREHFRSKLGFVLAAAGAAVGLGNIWGFPTQAANNGGGAFLLVYLVVVFALGYPALMAELLIGRFGQGNPVTSLQRVASGNRAGVRVGHFAGLVCLLVAVGVLSFYSIVAGWMVAFALAAVADVTGAEMPAPG